MKVKPVKYVTLGRLPGVSFKKAMSLFITVFGVLWLLLEPMSFFGMSPQLLVNRGWNGYLLLTVTALAGTISILNLFKRYKFANSQFIDLQVESSTDGGLHYVRVPENLQVWDFVALFLEHLRKGPARDRIDAISRMYSPVLYVRCADTARRISDNLTLKEANLNNNDVCFIKGRPHKHEIRYSLKR